jgi:hypothetical protein
MYQWKREHAPRGIINNEETLSALEPDARLKEDARSMEYVLRVRNSRRRQARFQVQLCRQLFVKIGSLFSIQFVTVQGA